MPVVEHGVSEARDDLSQLLNAAERGQWAVIRDRGGRSSVLLDWTQLDKILGSRASWVQEWHQLAEARAQLPRLHRDVAEAWAGISRRGREFALADADQLLEKLAAKYRFTTDVIYEPNNAVALWVAELALYGRGASYDEARSDLLEEVDVYLDDWTAELHAAPNHRAREGWVRRLQLLRDPEDRARALLEG